jgi:hypothetical protein
MFTTKKETLFDIARIKTGSNTNANAFLNAGMKESAKTLSGNGALKFSSSGNDFLDQFNCVASYKQPREFADIASDMSVLWAEDARKAVAFTLYLRIITRKVQLFDGSATETVQRGAGLKHEAIMRMLWIYQKDRNVFWNNIHLFIAVGSWKDIIQMLKYDLEYHGWDERTLNWNSFGDLIMAGLENPKTANLVKKYLPQIKARSKCTTIDSQSDTVIGKWLASTFELSYKGYRQLKTSGNAHDWQKLISQGKFLDINFDSVHGRALSLLVSGKFLANNELEAKYQAWIESKPVAKFTGYVHELFKDMPQYVDTSYYDSTLKPYQTMTIDKQFDGLVKLGKTNANCQSGLIVVRDTSSSMGSTAIGTNMSSNGIAKALGLYFGAFLEGKFADTWIEFANSAKMHKWKGSTATEKWMNDKSEAYGSTNFQSVANLFAKIKRDGVDESEFPTGILCISDGEFNSTQLGTTNVESFRKKLHNAGFSDDYVYNFKIILWNIPDSYYGSEYGNTFETFGEHENVFYISGYDPSTIVFLTGTEGKTSTPKNADELFDAAMDQEVLNMIEI